MTDYFQLLGQPRLPWLDRDHLKDSYLRLSSTLHPDHVRAPGPVQKAGASERFAELNAAYQCLNSSKDRLRHLVLLETGDRPKDMQDIPSDLANLFLQINQLCHGVDEFLTRRSRVTSPLLKVQLFEQAQNWVDDLTARQKLLLARQAELEAQLQGFNAAWETAPAIGSPDRREGLPLDAVEAIFRLLGYLARWTGQIQERILRLSL